MAPPILDICQAKIRFILDQFTDRQGFFASAKGTLFDNSVRVNTAINNLTSYDAFVPAYLKGITRVAENAPWHKEVYSSVRVRDGSTAMQPLNSPAVNEANIAGLNFSRASFWSSEAASKLRTLMKQLVLLYNVLDNNNLEMYLSGAWSVAGYDLDSNFSPIMVRSPESAMEADEVAAAAEAVLGHGSLRELNVQINDVVVIRRVLISYVHLVHLHLALFYMDRAGAANASQPQDAAANKTAAERVAHYAFSLLRKINDSTEDGSGDIGALITGLRERMVANKSDQKALDRMDKTMREIKLILAREKTLFEGEEKNHSKSRAIWIAALVVFGVVVAGAAAGTLAPDGARLLVAWSTVAVAAVAAPIFWFTSRAALTEGFSVAANSPLSVTEHTWTAENALNATTIDTYKRVILAEFSNALSNTIYVGLILQTYSGYGNMNAVSRREISYFDGVEFQMSQTRHQLHAQHRSMNLGAKQAANTVRAATFLGLIVALTAALAVSFPAAQVYVFTIGGVATVATVSMFYFMRMQYVRTDGSKMYYSQPDVNVLK